MILASAVAGTARTAAGTNAATTIGKYLTKTTSKNVAKWHHQFLLMILKYAY